MEANKKCTENALKQALRKRQPGNLPSNFNYRMMEQVRLEAEKQRKRERTDYALRHDSGYIAIDRDGGLYTRFQIRIQLKGVFVQSRLV